MFFTAQNQMPGVIGWEVPMVLVVSLLASAWVLRKLVVRWTHQRRVLVMQEWARENDLKVIDALHLSMPEALEELAPLSPTVRQLLAGEDLFVVGFTTPKQNKKDTSQFTTWNAMICRIKFDWQMTALRPRANASGLIDLFSTTSYPSLAPPERFVIFGVDPFDARKLAESKLAGLLPGDIGLVLYKKWLILDFSARPFDTIELSRCRQLMEQLVANLP